MPEFSVQAGKKRNNIKNNFSMLCPYLTYAIKSLHKFIFFFSCTFKMKAIPTLHSFHLFIAWEMLCIKLWSVSDLTSEFVFSWSKAKEYNWHCNLTHRPGEVGVSRLFRGHYDKSEHWRLERNLNTSRRFEFPRRYLWHTLHIPVREFAIY